MIRRYFIWQHRWVGLLMAGFLIVAGLTGTILAFDEEINERLIPERTHVPVRDKAQIDPLTLRERAQASTHRGKGPLPSEALAWPVSHDHPSVEPSPTKMAHARFGWSTSESGDTVRGFEAGG